MPLCSLCPCAPCVPVLPVPPVPNTNNQNHQKMCSSFCGNFFDIFFPFSAGEEDFSHTFLALPPPDLEGHAVRLAARLGGDSQTPPREAEQRTPQTIAGQWGFPESKARKLFSWCRIFEIWAGTIRLGITGVHYLLKQFLNATKRIIHLLRYRKANPLHPLARSSEGINVQWCSHTKNSTLQPLASSNQSRLLHSRLWL